MLSFRVLLRSPLSLKSENVWTGSTQPVLPLSTAATSASNAKPCARSFAAPGWLGGLHLAWLILGTTYARLSMAANFNNISSLLWQQSYNLTIHMDTPFPPLLFFYRRANAKVASQLTVGPQTQDSQKIGYAQKTGYDLINFTITPFQHNQSVP